MSGTLTPLMRSIAILEAEARMCDAHVQKLKMVADQALSPQKDELLRLCGDEIRCAADLRAREQDLRNRLQDKQTRC